MYSTQSAETDRDQSDLFGIWNKWGGAAIGAAIDGPY